MVFEVAVYTDVTRDESIDGTDGFNFQSASSGLDGNHQRQIRETLLHQISNRWPIDREPTDHPETSVYLRTAESSYFSRGRSTGKTHSGRRGNQLTQAIVTSETADLDPYVPAQLHGAHGWNLVPSDTSSCSQWFAPLDIDESFASERLWALFREDEWALAVLPAFLTMLEQSVEDPNKRTVVVHHDIDTVLRWFAAGTLLLARVDALNLEYRAFVTDAVQTRAQLIGIHPEFSNTSLAGLNVIDLVERTASPVEVSKSASKIASWVARLEMFEAFEVIAIARRWMPDLGAELGADGAELVTCQESMSTGRAEWQCSLRVIQELSRLKMSDDLALYLDELLSSVTSYRLRGQEDYVTAASALRFAVTAGIDGLVEAILLPTLESLATEPEHSARWAEALDVDAAWVWPAVSEPRQLTELVSEVVAGAPTEALPRLFPILSRLEVPADEVNLEPAIRAVSKLLFSKPESAQGSIDGWFAENLIRADICDYILAGLRDSSTTARYRGALEQGVWEFAYAGRSMRGTSEGIELNQWLAAARIAKLAKEDRGDAILHCTSLPGSDHWDYVLASTALPADSELYIAWLRSVGASKTLRAFLLKQFDGVLRGDPRSAKWREVELWITLAQALSRALPHDQEVALTSERLTKHRANIPSLMDLVKEKGEGLTGMFRRRQQEEEGH